MGAVSFFSWRRMVKWVMGVALTLAFLGILAAMFPHQVLTIDSGEVKAEALVVLGGGTNERPARAAELFASGAAPLILVSGFGDGETNARVLRAQGVPASALLREPDSLSTLENAKQSVALLRQGGIRRAIIVTSWYHSRRALACFHHVAPEMEFYSRPAYGTYPPAEWQREGTSHYIRAEYLKLAGYWICYGVWPLPPTP